MRVRLSRRLRFEAAHRLVSPRLSDAENQRVYGKCCREGGHGHNYEVWVTLEGEPDAATGFLVSREDLDRRLAAAVVERVDHRNLNDVLDCVTTGENLAAVFRDWVAAELEPSARLVEVEVVETARNRFRVGGE